MGYNQARVINYNCIKSLRQGFTCGRKLGCQDGTWHFLPSLVTWVSTLWTERTNSSKPPSHLHPCTGLQHVCPHRKVFKNCLEVTDGININRETYQEHCVITIHINKHSLLIYLVGIPAWFHIHLVGGSTWGWRRNDIFCKYRGRTDWTTWFRGEEQFFPQQTLG